MSEFQSKGTSLPPGKPVIPAGPLQDSFNRLQEAEQLRQRQQFVQAQSICESLLQGHPDYMAALHTLGLIFADQANYDEALDCLVRAVMLNPRSWTTLTALSGVYLRLGAIEMAMQTIEQAKSIAPRDASVLVTLGDIYRDEREYKRARDVYRQALAIEPNFVSAAIGLGWCYKNLGDDAEAAQIFEGLIKRGMRTLEPIRALANLPASVVSIDLLPHLDRAVRDLSEDKADFENSVAFFRAIALERAGRHAEAWKHLAPANRAIFLTMQKNLSQISKMQRATLAALHAHPGNAGRPDSGGGQPLSLFILGPSGSGKTTMEWLVSKLAGIKRGYENPIVENAVRRTFQTANLLTVSLLENLPKQYHPLCREIYFEELARRVGSATVFTNTLSTCIHDAAHMVSVFRNVRFIFMKRNVDDNLLRVYMRKYTRGNAYGYDLKAARDYIVWYQQMMDLMAEKFPNIVRVISYEDMVADPAASLRTVADLCGLPMVDSTALKITGDIGCAAPYRQFMAVELES